jgi:SAM-dependent methyltransferase
MTDNIELVRRQFGASAAAYATSRVHAQGASLGRLIELVQPRADWRVLDIATGAGHTAFAVAPFVAHVTATDITVEMIAVAEDLRQARGIHNVSTRLANAEALPFDAGNFELVTCRIAAHHFGRVDRFVSEAFRVLIPEGLLAVIDNISPEDDDGAQYLDAIERLRDPSHVHSLSLSEWRAAFAAGGFEIQHAELVEDKAMGCVEWARRMRVTDAVEQELRRQILEAPPTLARFLRPEPAGDDLTFFLPEALVVGRKGVHARRPDPAA